MGYYFISAGHKVSGHCFLIKMRDFFFFPGTQMSLALYFIILTNGGEFMIHELSIKRNNKLRILIFLRFFTKSGYGA